MEYEVLVSRGHWTIAWNASNCNFNYFRLPQGNVQVR